MTVIDPARKPEMIELGREQIFVRYRDMSVQVDQDVVAEKGVHRVDVFTKPTGDDGAFHAITTHDKFRTDAARCWGAVRPELATAGEKSSAQGRFENSLVFAHYLLAEFTNALNDKQIGRERVGDRIELFHVDPAGERHRIYLRSVSPTNPRLASLELEDDDGMRVVVSNPGLLKPLRSRLEVFLRWQMAANARMPKR